MTCPLCQRSLPPERAALGLYTCVGCAQRHPTPKYRGAMVYGHKTAGAVALMTPSEFDLYKKVTRRRGQQSVLRNVLLANGRAL